MFKNDHMGQVYADIELINGGDLELVRRGYMDKDEIKRTRVNILVDTGSIMPAINEYIQEQMQFPVTGKQRTQLADGNILECAVVSNAELRFRNRETTCRALVLPGDSEPLPGVIPLEDMDVMIHSQRQELIVNPEHPDFPVTKLKRLPAGVPPLLSSAHSHSIPCLFGRRPAGWAFLPPVSPAYSTR